MHTKNDDDGFLDPAATIIDRLGGTAAVAKRLGKDRSTVCQWRVPRARGGTDGLIPQKHHPEILEFAAELKVRLRAADFLPRRAKGRFQSQVAAAQ